MAFPASSVARPETSFPLAHAYDAFAAARGAARAAADKKRLRDVFNLASEVPALADALDWAEKNGVRFFIDDQATGCGGYYVMGTGAVALVQKDADGHIRPLSWQVSVIAHEIRHAWQDYHGLLPFSAAGDDFSVYYRKIALTEADAFAVQKLAECQTLDAQRDDSMSSMTGPRLVRLAGSFRRWYACDFKTSFYGDFACNAAGFPLGVAGTVDNSKKTNLEFSPPDERPPHPSRGADIRDAADVRRFGAWFQGNDNYLDQPGMTDFIASTALNHPLAMRFFAAQQQRQHPMARRVQRATRTAQRQAYWSD